VNEAILYKSKLIPAINFVTTDQSGLKLLAQGNNRKLLMKFELTPV